jgi:hypothetical protein
MRRRRVKYAIREVLAPDNGLPRPCPGSGMIALDVDALVGPEHGDQQGPQGDGKKRVKTR